MTKKKIAKITKELQGYCDRLNEHMPCKNQEDVDALTTGLARMRESVKGSRLYWSREVFLSAGFEDEKCTYIMTHKECLFVPVCDIEGHVGVKVIYVYEEKED